MHFVDKKDQGGPHGWQSDTTDKEYDSEIVRPVVVSVGLPCHPWCCSIFRSGRHLSVRLFFCPPLFRFFATWSMTKSGQKD